MNPPYWNVNEVAPANIASGMQIVGVLIAINSLSLYPTLNMNVTYNQFNSRLLILVGLPPKPGDQWNETICVTMLNYICSRPVYDAYRFGCGGCLVSKNSYIDGQRRIYIKVVKIGQDNVDIGPYYSFRLKEAAILDLAKKRRLSLNMRCSPLT